MVEEDVIVPVTCKSPETLTVLPDWVMLESPRVLVPVKIGMVFAVPEPLMGLLPLMLVA